MAARSYLFVPGDRPDRFLKAWNSGADAVILDLEDSVAVECKPRARDTVATWLSAERPVYVRVNGPTTEWFADDLAAIGHRPGLRGVVLPRAEDSRRLADTAAQLPEGVTLLPIIETALAVWNVREIAAVPRVERLAFGWMDLQLDTGIDGPGEELLYARSRLVLASRITGIPPPVDGVTATLDDPDTLKADVERARRLGFRGKLCIHPRQIPIVNQGFRPSDAQVAWAKKVMAAAEASSAGAFRLDGEMVDRPMIDRARRILEQAF